MRVYNDEGLIPIPEVTHARSPVYRRCFHPQSPPAATPPPSACWTRAPPGCLDAIRRRRDEPLRDRLPAPRGDGYRLRWFTPAVEVSLCGHATLASAHILWESGALQPDQAARFYTLSGLLTARRVEGWIELDFPARQPEPAAPPPGLLEALGVQPVSILRSKNTFLLELPDEAAVRAAAPDFARLFAVESARAACVTSRASRPRL